MTEKFMKTPYGFVPRHLHIKDKPEFSDFPYNVMFMSWQITDDGKLESGVALYEPLLKSYREKESVRSMKYYNIYSEKENFSWLEIDYSLTTKEYHGRKYVKNQIVTTAYGSTWKDFFINFTLHGLYNMEKCKFSALEAKQSKKHRK